MSGIRKAQADQTRMRIIVAARQLFTEPGYFNTGTGEIVDAAQAGTRGALYHHFPSKKALFRAVLEQIQVELADQVRTAISASQASDRLTQALQGFLDASLDPQVRRILLIDGPAVLGWAEWRGIEIDHGLGALGALLQEGVREGSIIVSDVDAMAHLLLSLVDEAALYIAHADDPAHAREVMGRSLTALLEGLH